VLSALEGARLVLPSEKGDLALQGTEQDRAARNRLQAPRLAKALRRVAAHEGLHSGMLQGQFRRDLPSFEGTTVCRCRRSTAPSGLTTEGLGLTPGNPLNFIQARNAGRSPDAWQLVRSAMGGDGPAKRDE